MIIWRRAQIQIVMNSNDNISLDEQFLFHGKAIFIYTANCYLHFHLFSNFMISTFSR